jgi:PHD finger-like domain-containing protein 5A
MTAARHHADLILCRKQPGIAVGRLCEKCDGKCPVCDSTVAPTALVHICDECNYGSQRAASTVTATTTGLTSGKCVICNGAGVADAYYCRQCTALEKDRDGCPKIVNLSSARLDMIYERKKFAFKPRVDI